MTYQQLRNLVVGFSVMIDMDLTIIQRNGYTVIDLLSDIWGIQSFLSTAISFFIGIWNHNLLDNYLVSRLFTLQIDDKVKNMHHSKHQQATIKEYFMDRVVPSKIACCKRTR